MSTEAVLTLMTLMQLMLINSVKTACDPEFFTEQRMCTCYSARKLKCNMFNEELCIEESNYYFEHISRHSVEQLIVETSAENSCNLFWTWLKTVKAEVKQLTVIGYNCPTDDIFPTSKCR